MKINYQKLFEEEIKKIKNSGKRPSLLLHACCAPCSSAVLEVLNDTFDITLFFYNPNISPEKEFNFRLEELKRLLKEMNLNNINIVAPVYNNEEFEYIARGMEDLPEGSGRCKKCYKLRLEETAKYAKEHCFDYFTTTLSVSPYKNADALNEIGAELEKAFGVMYLYSDFKKKNGYKRSCELSKQFNLYRQNYCGCIYSKIAAEEKYKSKENNMSDINALNPQRVFYYFKQISDVPRGSGNCAGIARFCKNFAVNHDLKYIRDDSDNVVIFKPGTPGYENSDPIILQGHTDMVCQKTDACEIDFTKNGIELLLDGDFLKAKNTTLGGDNGIAVAMILAILESNDIPHPPIEAVFTSDEEIGLIGAGKLDKTKLRSKKMINLDSEENDTVTVSCAGGSELSVSVNKSTETKHGTKIIIELKDLKGGHSGVEINGNRVNADMLAGRFLNHLNTYEEFDIISINGGDKSNAIPNNCKIELCVYNVDSFMKAAKDYLNIIKEEISAREPDFRPCVSVKETGEFNVFDTSLKDKLIFSLLCAPNGIMEMSAEVDGLVETSLNLGILQTQEDKISLSFALRSNKYSGLIFLEEKLVAFFKSLNWESETFGHYPPWEYKKESSLRDIYVDLYSEQLGKPPKIEAIHAGLECGVFASDIENFDCISIGPALYDVHTVNEKLSISSTEFVYNLLLKILEKLK